MNAAAVLYALQILQLLPAAISAGQNFMAIIMQGQAALQQMIVEKRNPTDAEWDALNAVTLALQKQLHAPS